ncbi:MULTISPECIES: DUF1876 domain-containing protein [unclassified Pseudofrankia]|uniref:DUF1876 domain-containing protein n=1 Tax=unclassified Pseudofrankia TaxID=2994372 RepID=UPI0008D9A4E4|nr:MULTISPECIES: DUF1876 domain-containing protein [unclassified Pseudofrankia]OHV42505.1 hypothetical protein BCD48_31190 [Pseudofrankia sp. BMG5.36]
MTVTKTKTWTVDVQLIEDEGRTRAEARLHGNDAVQLGKLGTGEEIRAVGLARCHPHDADVPTIGDEVAASRALSDLAHQLLDTAARNIESRTGKRAIVQP